jgi:hypothetical protein
MPPGAHVFDGASDLGAAPLEHEFPPGRDRASFEFRLDGYTSTPVEADIKPGAVVTAKLVKKTGPPPPRKKPTQKKKYEMIDF